MIKTTLKLSLITVILTAFILSPFFVISSPLQVVGVVKEAHNPKPETKVYLNYFGVDTAIYTNNKGLYDVTLDVPFKSGYISIRTSDCIGDTIENVVFYTQNQQLIISDFELCKSNFRTFLTGKVFYHKLPARGAKVELSLNNFHSVLEILYTDADGKFESYMGTGPIKYGTMTARVKDCTGRYIYNQVDFRDGDTLNLSFVKCKPPGETLITGQVKYGQSNTTKNQVKLLLYVLDRDKKDLVIADSTITEIGGGYHFFLKDIEAYTIRSLPVSKNSMVFPTYINGATFWDEDPVIKFEQLDNQIRKDVFMTQKFQAISYKTINGKIAIENQKGLSRKQPAVLLLNMEKEPVSYTYADNNGNYEFERIQSGEYFIWVDDPGKLTIPIRVILEENAQSLEAEDIVVTDYAIGSRSTSQKENELSQNAISLYPNPFVNFIRLSTENKMDLEVDVYSISGELLISEKMSSDEPLNTTELSKGTYILRIKSKEETIVQRMIKY